MASRTPLTVSPGTRTSLMVRTCEFAPVCVAPTTVLVALPYGTNGRPDPRGTITTSPLAESPDGDRLNTILPLLPVAGLLYSPAHFPASDARAPESPLIVIGVGFDAQANAIPANATTQS